MVRIEKTEINASAFIILMSTLQKIKDKKIVEIAGKGIVIRDKKPQETEEFSIDLALLKKMFEKFVTGGPKALVVDGADEDYLRNLSYACDFYQKEEHKFGEFDHFALLPRPRRQLHRIAERQLFRLEEIERVHADLA